MKRLLPEIIVACALLMVVGYGFAQVWTRTPALLYPLAYIAESADGRIILAVGSGGYLSTNSGVSWNYAVNSYYPCAAVNADGSEIVAGINTNSGFFVYISTNLCATWIPTILPNTNWNACAASADGRVLAVAVGNDYMARSGYIYTSTNFGVNWRTNNLNKNWRALAASADGTRIAAVAVSDYVYLSTNSGLTWQPSGATGSWRSIASSMDGQRLVATGDTGTAISTNAGFSWRSISMNGYSVASSADGHQLVVVDDGTSISTSTNYGLSWGTTNISGMYFAGAGSSADGCELFLGGNDNDGVWKWQATPSPNLGTASRNHNVTLSWLVASTNLVMQQSPDLSAGSWIALTNSPGLSYSNLQNYLTLPPTNGSIFYRLATP